MNDPVDNKSVSAKQQLLAEMKWLDHVMGILSPHTEEYAVMRRIRTLVTSCIGARFYSQIEFDAACRRYRPDIKTGSKEYRRMLSEARYCMYCYGAVADDFFAERLYEKNHYGRNRFISTGKRYSLYQKFNGTVVIPEIDAKCDCAQFYREFYKRDFVCIRGESDRERFYEFFAKHDRAIIKPNREYGGHGVRLITASEVTAASDIFEKVLKEYGEAILEEIIIQDDRMAYFNRDSVNTIRVETVFIKGQAQILFTMLRYGSPGHIVDNLCGGGNSIMVDHRNGVTYSHTISGTIDPDSGIQVCGISIPRWNELLETGIKAAEQLSKYKLLAYDFALSKDKGWVMVEANSHGGFATVSRAGLCSELDMDELCRQSITE